MTTETHENTIPNFDGMTSAELMAFWKKYTRPTRKDAAALIGDTRKGYTTLAARCAAYAVNKATAMTCREAGKISSAQAYESICEQLYNKLPEDLRW